MTYQDVVKADVLRPYCEAMGVASVDALPKGKAKAPDDIEIRCGMMILEGIKEPSYSQWDSPTLNPHIPTTIDIFNPFYSMNIHFSDEELSDFEVYDANRATRLVAEDEGKTFTKVLQKPAGYDAWVARENTISIANWVSEKRDNSELDVNEIGRKILKRTLYRSLGAGPSNYFNRHRNNTRRPVAFKAPAPLQGRPPTPYPQIGGVPLITGPDGRLQLSQVGGRLSAYSIPDAGSSNSYPAPASAYHRDILTSENARLRRELEEFRTREVSTIQPEQTGFSNAVTPNGTYSTNGDCITIRDIDIYLLIMIILEIGLKMVGLTISDPPLVRPIAERAFATIGDTNMATN
jgi:hypothetical protein